MALRLLPSLLACGLVLAACGSTVELPGDAEACAGIRCIAGTCYSNGGQPMCRCGEWEAAAAVACSVGAFETPDEYGGSPSDATVLTLPMTARTGELQVALHSKARDRDLFAFTAQAGHMYAFRCGRVTLNECTLRLLDDAGHPAPLSVSRSLEDGKALWVGVAQPEKAGTWYVEVRSDTSEGRYTYQLVDLGGDDHGNSREDATRLQALREPIAFPVTHGTPEDRDVFTFRAVAGQGYRFGCEHANTVYQELRLTTAGGQVLEVLQHYAMDRASVGALATRTEDWFVELRASEGTFPATSSCRLDDLGPDEHADAMEGATEVRPGFPVPVTFQSRADVDVLSFTGEPGHIYALRSGGVEDWEARVTDAAGVPLALSPTRPLSFEPASRGTYYVFLSRGPAWLSSFVLTVADLGLDDHGDTPEDATFIGQEAVATGRFETPLDTDAIAFSAEAGSIYLARCDPACDMSLITLGRIPTGFAPLGPGRYLVHAPWTERRTLLLRPLAGAGSFTLRLETVATDDYGDNALNATPLTVPATVSGILQTVVDEDVFAAQLVAERQYLLALPVSGLPVAVTDPNGVPVGFFGSVFTASTTGTYLIRVHGGSGVTQQPWHFTLREF